jgi:hypothetical protein
MVWGTAPRRVAVVTLPVLLRVLLGTLQHLLPRPLPQIRLIESNAECRHLKQFTCKGTLRQRPNPKKNMVYVILCRS